MYDEVELTTHCLAFGLLMVIKFAYAPPAWHQYRVMYLNIREEITVIRQHWSPPSPSAGSGPIPLASSPTYEFFRAPFADFPIIKSHVHPFCVIYNAGQKLIHKPYFNPPSHINQTDLEIVRRLYQHFSAPAPSSWGRDVPTVPCDSSSDGERSSHKRRWHRDDSGPSRQPRRATAHTGQTDTQAAIGKEKCRNRHGCSSKGTGTADLSMPGDASTSENDSFGLIDGVVLCGDCLPQGLEDWAMDVALAATHGGGSSPLLNDNQIGRYCREQARKPFQHPWHSWRVDWGHTCQPDTSKFSSNDWAYWMRTRYLTI
jgi:hypothetical protein